MPAGVTILIAARNAAATIERAVSSCLPEAGCAIVLVDDHCTDGTAARARAVGGSRLRVVEAPGPGGVAIARQTGVDTVETELAAWLDADDEWMPGRAARLAGLLDTGHDVAIEAIDLHDGPSGAKLRTLTVPTFLRRPGAAVRLFERNFLPGDTQVAFRTSVFRDAGGYDATLRGPESFDLLLRVVRAGARLVFGDTVGYRMYAYPASLSRNLTRQRGALATALRKHDYADIKRLYRSAGYSDRVADWALVMVAQFRFEPAIALSFLDDACPVGTDPTVVLEPDGPWPQPEGWRRAFHRGTILLQQGGHANAAIEELTRAESIMPTPEGANNLGVALWRTGGRAAAADAFALAAERYPGYHDALVNATASVPSLLTTHPLRREASRREYAAA